MLNDKQTYDTIKQIVLDVINKEKALIGNWHLGTVDQIISPTKLKVFVDGSTISQTISCNPDVTFTIGDHVWVIFINGNQRDKFVLCHRAVV